MSAEEDRKVATRVKRTTWLLALITLMPFVVLAVALTLAGRDSGWFLFLTDVFKTWSAITLAFLGGIRWGLALNREKVVAQLMLGVIPAIIGWPALFAPDRVGIAILLVGHCAQGAWDSLSAGRGQVPRWFGEMRMILTLIVAAAHIAVFVALF